MLKNYLKIAFRNIQKNAVYSFINIFGLTVGIACSILILLWVHDEVSYDKFHSNIDRLHQVWINAVFDGKVNTWNSVPLPTEEGLRQTDSNIRRAATTDWGGDHLLTVGETRFNKKGYFATEEFLEMFQFPLLKGNATQVLDDPYSIVLTESAAKSLFHDEDPINQIVRVDNAYDLKVTGILKDIPSNSSLEFDCIIPFGIYEKQDWVKNTKENWGNYSFQVFVELQPNASETSVENNIRDLLIKKGQTDIKREFFLHPMERWRLHSNFENGKESGGMIEYVNMFTLIAVFILIIACINFMNLATARSERRAREVGVRKSVGSHRKDLIFQFLGESILISLFAFAAAVLLCELVLPFYNTLVDKRLDIDYTSGVFWVAGLGLTFITGILAGSYPAFYLSSFNVARVLKGKIQVGKSGSTPRKVLVVLQFVFSMTLIVCSIVIQQQISHVKSRSIGYNRENLITIDYTTEIGKNYEVIKEELLGSGVVESVTKSNSPITSIYSNNFLSWPGKPEDQKVIFTTIATEYDYTKTMGIKMLDGRDFSKDFPADSTAIIINKAALDIMALKEPIGTTVELWGGKRQIIGIVDNVLMGSLFREVSPMFMVLDPSWSSAVTVRLGKTNDIQASIKKVEDIFKKYNSAYPFEYSFVDVEFAKKFSTINMISNLGAIFTFLAICITGLGLFGLAAFTAEQRTKEVGIRKVLGASVSNLILLISKEFSLLVIIAFIVSAPFAWWGSKVLLEQYQYKIGFPVWVIPVSGAISLLFALFIVSTQAFKAATSNPVKSLRSE
ncbi:ABC transporter permease [Chryseosolibacter indicus]|uniref:ABC transporter permease n=1 Tax=Chryseosolibacter indicus TaxID=2782351 RepID=A0ABS5VRX5_9BACT|nr:ABC transporter permease [Chryseosolibacter indicus]MBT1703537.1 ABC transporter permease [Chryseosolibacter indicus]